MIVYILYTHVQNNSNIYFTETNKIYYIIKITVVFTTIYIIVLALLYCTAGCLYGCINTAALQ